MNLVAFVVIILVLAFLLWLFNAKIPMDSMIRLFLNIILVLAILLVILRFLNVWPWVARL